MRPKVWRSALARGRTRPRSDEEHLSAAVRWLCRSQDVTASGGSANCYNLVLGWEDEYPETTGYLIPTFYAFAAETDRPAIARRARAMADWLCEIQHPDGSFPAGTGESGDPSTFNTGQIVFGLVDAYRRTGDEAYRKAALDAADWLVRHQSGEGYWDSYTYKDTVHTYSTRVAWALLDADSLAKGSGGRYRDAARKNLEWAAGKQRPNGWFDGAGFTRSDEAFLHTIAYTIRGLLEGGVALEDASLVEAAKRSADVLLERQRRHGVLKGSYDDAWRPTWYYCPTGNAQMAIVWLRLYQHTGETTYLPAARETVAFLKRRQPLEAPREIRGALPGSSPIFGRYLFLRYPNWAAKFFVDAILLRRRCERERFLEKLAA